MVAIPALPAGPRFPHPSVRHAREHLFVFSASRHRYYEVARLFGSGLSDREIARRTGVPQGTVSRWHRARTTPVTVRRHDAAVSWAVLDAPIYCYLLGAYLGDGTVSHQPPGFWSLQVVNDRRYEAVSNEILDAMRITFPGATPRRWPSSHGESVVLHVAHPAIATAFPQHGPGRKHVRPIVLADWQRALTRAHPAALVRGLIHSDGCRTLNQVRTTLPSGRVAEYRYVRYFFTNRSIHIREIFVEHCALLGVRVTQSNTRNLSISQRASVAILEHVVGEKR